MTQTQSTRREEAIHRQILEQLRDQGVPSEEVVESLRRVRAERAESVLSLRADEAQEKIAEDVRALEDRLRALQENGRAQRESVEEAFSLGAQIRWNLWLADCLVDEARQDPLSFIETELDWIARCSRDLERWDDALAPDAEVLAEAVGSKRPIVWRSRLKRFLDFGEAPGERRGLDEMFAAWRSAAEAFSIELHSHESDRLPETTATGGRRGSLASLRRSSEFPEVERLRRRREALLKVCRDAFQEIEPAEKCSFALQVATDLVERSSAVLSETAASLPQEQVPAMRMLRRRIASYYGILGDWRRDGLRKGVLPEADRARLQAILREIERVRRQARRLQREQEAFYRLENYFGPTKVRLFERFIFFLIAAFLALLIVEWRLPEGSPWLPVVYQVDLFFCFFFQVDFFVRWYFARWSGSYFFHHFFLESLPAIPFGFLLHNYGLGGLAEFRVVVGARVLRLRFIMLLLVRLVRVVVFFVRGTDRVVEKLRPVLDRDVLLFGSGVAAGVPDSPLRQRLLDLESEDLGILRGLYSELPWSERTSVLRGYLDFLEVDARVSASQALPYNRHMIDAAQPVHIEIVIQRLLRCDVARTIALLGRDGANRISRWLKFLDLPGFRRAPVIRRLASAARIASPTEAVSAAAQAVGQVLEDFVALLRFWTDLSGITTGPQILDRVAAAMIAASKRPAVRLLLLGVVALVVGPIAGFFHVKLVQNVLDFVGLPLVVLGSICLVVFFLGLWLRRISGEALDVYLRTADAHFYSLLKVWKHRSRDEHLGVLTRAVLAPEAALRCSSKASDEEVRSFLEEGLCLDAPFDATTRTCSSETLAPLISDRKLVDLWYRDFLDGPILHRGDDKTSVQMLGNLLLQDIRKRTLGLSRKELRRLEQLDLEKERLFSFGPYLWFRFITESLAIETAKLVQEYNSCCVPLARVDAVSQETVRRFQNFLAQRRSRARLTTSEVRETVGFSGEPMALTDFNAFHFLTADSGLDEEVRERFGDDVLRALRYDRSGLVRDVFGTRPYHRLPSSRRAVNPYRLYRRYLGGAKFFFLPFVILLAIGKIAWFAASQMKYLVEEVLGRKRVLRCHLGRRAGFDVAVRKISRMRKPVFMEALRFRAAMDVGYLGLRLPGFELMDSRRHYEEDLDFISATRAESSAVAQQCASATEALRRFRNFLAERGWIKHQMQGLLEILDVDGELQRHRGEVIRALVTAFVTNHDELRSVITAEAEARQFVQRALEQVETFPGRLRSSLRGWLLSLLPRGRRRARVLRGYFSTEGDFSDLSRGARRKVLRLFLAGDAALERFLVLATEGARRSVQGEDAVLEKLRQVAWNYPSWTRKILTVRTLQVLTVLDIRAYRDLVWEVGEYEEDRPS